MGTGTHTCRVTVSGFLTSPQLGTIEGCLNSKARKFEEEEDIGGSAMSRFPILHQPAPSPSQSSSLSSSGSMKNASLPFPSLPCGRAARLLFWNHRSKTGLGTITAMRGGGRRKRRRQEWASYSPLAPGSAKAKLSRLQVKAENKLQGLRVGARACYAPNNNHNHNSSSKETRLQCPGLWRCMGVMHVSL